MTTPVERIIEHKGLDRSPEDEEKIIDECKEQAWKSAMKFMDMYGTHFPIVLDEYQFAGSMKYAFSLGNCQPRCDFHQAEFELVEALMLKLYEGGEPITDEMLINAIDGFF